jgi:hypothetical protein
MHRVVLEISKPIKSIPPSGMSSTYKKHTHTHTLELVLLLHRGLGFLFQRAFTYCILFSAFIYLQLYTQKSQKYLQLLLLYLPSILTNTISSSWVWQPFIFQRYYNWLPALGSHHLVTCCNIRCNLTEWAPSIFLSRRRTNPDRGAHVSTYSIGIPKDTFSVSLSPNDSWCHQNSHRI